MSKNVLTEIFKTNPTILISLLYLYLSAVGLYYSVTLFRFLNVDIINYYLLSDFILVSITNKHLFYYAIFNSIVGLITFRKIGHYFRNTPPIDEHTFNPFKLFYQLTNLIIHKTIFNAKIAFILMLTIPFMVASVSAKFQSSHLLDTSLSEATYKGNIEFIKDIENLLLKVLGQEPLSYPAIKLSIKDISREKELDNNDLKLLGSTSMYLFISIV